MSTELYPRRALETARDSLSSFRALVVQGARQVGKSTMAELLAREIRARYITLDREEDLAAARDDPSLLLDAIGTPAVIDEVQRVGDPLILALTQRLDAPRTTGQYVLTGSTNFLTTPTISESLAGRIDLITLWPLSMGEITGGPDSFVNRAGRGVEALLDHAGPTPTRNEYLELVCRGGYPEVQHLSGRARRRWFERYLETVLRREVESAADLRRFDALSGMARVLLSTTGAELVVSRLAERLGIDRTTADAYDRKTAHLVGRIRAPTPSPRPRRPRGRCDHRGCGRSGRRRRGQGLDGPPRFGRLLDRTAPRQVGRHRERLHCRGRVPHRRPKGLPGRAPRRLPIADLWT